MQTFQCKLGELRHFASGSYFLEAKSWTDLHFTVTWLLPPCIAFWALGIATRCLSPLASVGFWLTDRAWIFLQILHYSTRGPFQLIIPCTEGYLGLNFYHCSLFAATSLFCSVMWALLEQLQCLKTSQSDQGSACGWNFEGLELVKPCWPEQNNHLTWGRLFFPCQNSDLVFKAIKLSESSSQGESLFHGIKCNMQKVLWFSVLLRAWGICQNKMMQYILFMCWSIYSAPALSSSATL